MNIDIIRERLAADPSEAPAEALAMLATSDDAADLTASAAPAAVLVLIVHGEEPGILLTKRTSTLAKHAGQVAFPGGRIDRTDVSVEAAALREAYEEVGLPPDQPEILGRLPDYITGTGFRISPVLALLPRPVVLQASPDEVEAIFTLPLDVLLDPAAPQLRRAEFRGQKREFWVWPHEHHHIWGATAAILVNLATRLRAQVRAAA